MDLDTMSGTVSEANLQNAVGTVGPISVSMMVNKAWFNYAGGGF